MTTTRPADITEATFKQAIRAGHETLVELMTALGLTRNQAKHLRDKLVADGVIEPYAMAVSRTRGQRLYKYRVVGDKNAPALVREGDRVVQTAIGSLQGHSGPFAALLSSTGEKSNDQNSRVQARALL